MNDSFLKPLIRTVPETDWVMAVVCLVSILYIISRILFPRYHTRITHAFFNRYEAAKLIEEKNVLFNRGGFLLNLVPLFCIAMIVYQQIGYFKPELVFVNPSLHYLRVLTAVFIFCGGRILVVYLFGYSFEQNEIALRFNQVWLLQFENLGTFILIPSMILPFSIGIVKILVLIILWFILILWVLYTILRELELLKSYRISIFYMFLYLCTLEILPLWWVVQSMTEGW
ncbi:MAG: DUF4271 domain-containing protein [Porphyromonadaceae bacterium]|nr:MAG: DUF4271 domain-containing protein [Porphyromonadaceae bacterium]